MIIYSSSATASLRCHPMAPYGRRPEFQVLTKIPLKTPEEAITNIQYLKDAGWCAISYLGIWSYFTHLNYIAAIKGDEFPKINHDSRLRENSEVVIIYPVNTWRALTVPAQQATVKPNSALIYTEPSKLVILRLPHRR